jgi:hypothetical protein
LGTYDGGGRRAAQQGREKITAALEGVVESDALPGQQQGAVELILGQGQRTKASGVGHQCLALGPAP